MEELLKQLEEKPELAREVEALWTSGASAREVADMLSGKGVAADVARVEELLALLQKRRAEAIGDGERIDKEALRQVAGGRSYEQCLSMYKDDTDCYVSALCTLILLHPTTLCDDFFECNALACCE